MNLMRVALLIFSLAFSLIAQVDKNADEIEIQTLLQRYYELYGKANVVGAIELWSSRSPSRNIAKEVMQRQLAYDIVSFTNLTVTKIKITGAAATGQVKAEQLFSSTADGQELKTRVSLSHQFSLIKENGEWKIWSEMSLRQALAEALTPLRNEAEQSRLLAEEQEIVSNAEFIRLFSGYGETALAEEKYAEALNIYRIILKLTEKGGDNFTLVSTRFMMGYAHLALQEYEQAEINLLAALKLANEIKRTNLRFKSLYTLGSVYYLQNNFLKAQEHYRKALQAAIELKDAESQATAEVGLALVDSKFQEYDSAVSHYQKAEQLFSQSDNKASQASARESIADIYSEQDKFADALPSYRAALTKYEAVRDKIKVIVIWHKIGSIYYRQEELEIALEHYQKALTLARESNDQPAIAVEYHSIGQVQMLQGEYDAAGELFASSRKIFEATNDKGEVARVLESIGNLNRFRRNYPDALRYYQESLTLNRAVNNLLEASRVLSNIGLVQTAQGNYEAALKNYVECLGLAEIIGNRELIGGAMADVAGVYFALKDFPTSLNYYQQSLPQFQATNNLAGLALVERSVGFVYAAQNNFTEAVKFHRTSLAAFETLGQKTDIALSLLGLSAALLGQGELAEAATRAARCKELAAQLGDWRLLWQTHFRFGQIYALSNQLSQAQQELDQALRLIESGQAEVGAYRDSLRFSDNRSLPYRLLVEIALQQNNVEQALVYSERLKLQLVRAMLNDSSFAVTKGMTLAEQTQERKLKSQLTTIEIKLARERNRKQPDAERLEPMTVAAQKARLELESFASKLFVRRPRLKTQRGNLQMLSSPQAENLLRGGQKAMLEYLVTDDKIILFVLTKGQSAGAIDLQAQIINLHQADLTDKIKRWREKIITKQADYQLIGRELYNLLLKPIEAQITGKTELIIAPDGILWSLPFGALQPQENTFLIENHEISFAPSLTVLREMNRLKAMPKNKVGLAKLLSVNAETQLVSETDRKKLLSEALRHRQLCFNSPLKVNDASPLYSKLLFANQGSLSVWELLNFDLKTDFVAFTQSELKPAPIASGEGVLGLHWALFVSGNSTTLLNLWEDESSLKEKFWSDFSQQLKTQNEGKALRAIALKRVNQPETKLPYFWAASILVRATN